jgi:hypothetical protein
MTTSALIEQAVLRRIPEGDITNWVRDADRIYRSVRRAGVDSERARAQIRRIMRLRLTASLRDRVWWV